MPRSKKTARKSEGPRPNSYVVTVKYADGTEKRYITPHAPVPEHKAGPTSRELKYKENIKTLGLEIYDKVIAYIEGNEPDVPAVGRRPKNAKASEEYARQAANVFGMKSQVYQMAANAASGVAGIIQSRTNDGMEQNAAVFTVLNRVDMGVDPSEDALKVLMILRGIIPPGMAPPAITPEKEGE